MLKSDVSRRTVLKGGAGSAALAGLTVITVAGPARAFPGRPDDGVLVPWLDQPTPVPPELAGILAHPLVWEQIEYLTPNDKFFTVKHYNQPQLSAVDWRLGITGLVAHPQSLSLADLKRLPRRAVTFALECSGNTNGAPFAIGLIGNAEWGGASLRDVLRRARPLDPGIEVVFWGADQGEVTIRDNTGVTGPGVTGTVADDGTGGLDLTVTEQFARSMSLDDAMSSGNLLCYEMNGSPLPADHGAPVRLIAPGLVRRRERQVAHPHRGDGQPLPGTVHGSRLREHPRGDAQRADGVDVHLGDPRTLKSAPAKVTRSGDRYTVTGAAWGAPIAKVEAQVDGGPWRSTTLARNPAPKGGSQQANEAAWSLWTLDWGTPAPGEHTIRSRAYDKDGNVQPTPQDPYITSRRTFWENNAQVTRRVLVP